MMGQLSLLGNNKRERNELLNSINLKINYAYGE